MTATEEKPDVVLEELRKLNRNGILLPEHVVAAAQPEDSPLHSFFEWDDTDAAHAYRIWQARQLIRTRVVLLENRNEPIRAFVSLTTDRDDGGYREITAVLSDKKGRKQLLADALAELEVFQRKYRELEELAKLFSEARNLRRKLAA